MRRSIPISAACKTQAGDYVESQLAERMDTRPSSSATSSRTGIKYGERRKTVAFAVGVGHSIHIRDEFVEVRRARRAHRRPDAEGRARRHPRTAGVRRDRGRHQLHGADRGLGHARGRLLHPGATDQEDGAVSPDGRPRACGRPTARPTRSCSTIPAPCSGTAYPRIRSSGRSIPIGVQRRPNTRSAQSSREFTAARMHAVRLAFASAASRVQIAGSCRNGHRASSLRPPTANSVSSRRQGRAPAA